MNRRRRIWATVFIALILSLALSSAAFTAGFVVGHTNTTPSTPTSSTPTGVASATVPANFDVFWQAWNLVQKDYVDQQAVDPTKMTYGAIQGMLGSLGDVGHTRFLTPQQLQDEQQSLSGQLEGIGAEITTRDGQPTIVAPIPGTPAQKAGILPGDLIIKVDGKDVTTMTLDDIVNLVRGPAGTKVTLTVIHPGDTAQTDITIVRAKINIPSVTWSILPGTTSRISWSASSHPTLRPNSYQRSTMPSSPAQRRSFLICGTTRRIAGRSGRSNQPVRQRGKRPTGSGRQRKQDANHRSWRRQGYEHSDGHPDQCWHREFGRDRRRRTAGSPTFEDDRRHDVWNGNRSIDVSPE